VRLCKVTEDFVLNLDLVASARMENRSLASERVKVLMCDGHEHVVADPAARRLWMVLTAEGWAIDLTGTHEEFHARTFEVALTAFTLPPLHRRTAPPMAFLVLDPMSPTELRAFACLLRSHVATRRKRPRRRVLQHLRAFARQPKPRTATTWPESPEVDTPVSPPFGPAAERVSFAAPWSSLPDHEEAIP
jgi:hypothetical protein